MCYILLKNLLTLFFLWSSTNKIIMLINQIKIFYLIDTTFIILLFSMYYELRMESSLSGHFSTLKSLQAYSLRLVQQLDDKTHAQFIIKKTIKKRCEISNF